MVVALFAPPLEAWIRWVAPFYALTITFRKPNCVHLASDSVADQATSSVLQSPGCVLLVVVVVVRALRCMFLLLGVVTRVVLCLFFLALCYCF